MSTDDLLMLRQEFWDERYGSRTQIWSGRPNPHLVARIAGRTPGRALDVGSGEGADAIWLAGQGWEVTAIDVSPVALGRAAEHAEAAGVELAARIAWTQADLLVWGPEAGSFDLVSSQFMHMPPEPRAVAFARLADGVAPGGTLLIVGHHPVDHDLSKHAHGHMLFTAEEVAASLDPGRWEVVATETLGRPGSIPEHGDETMHDAVLEARRIR